MADKEMAEKKDSIWVDDKGSETFGNWQIQITPEMSYEMLDGKTVTVTQNSRGFGELGSRLWDASYMMSRFLELHSDLVKGKNCVELGAGVGLSGIVAAKVGGKVKLTDKPALVPLMKHNIEKASVSDSATAGDLVWGTPQKEKYEVILGADLTYEFEHLPILVDTFLSLCTPESSVIIGYGIERQASSEFLRLVKEKFKSVKVYDQEEIVGGTKLNRPPQLDYNEINVILLRDPILPEK